MAENDNDTDNRLCSPTSPTAAEQQLAWTKRDKTTLNLYTEISPRGLSERDSGKMAVAAWSQDLPGPPC